MNENTVLQFTSKECKNEIHSKCHSSWTGLDWDSISFAAAYVIQKSVVFIIKTKVQDYQLEMALEQQVVRPACSNTSSQNQPLQQHEVLLDG